MIKSAILFLSLCVFQSTNAQCAFDPIITGELILCPNGTEILSTQVYDSYQWHKRAFNEPVSFPIPGDTSQTISVSNPDDVLFYFSVEATLNGCTELSPEVLIDGWAFLPVTVASTGDFTIGDNGESIVCDGDTMYFTLNLPYDTNITWFLNGSPIPSATSNKLPVSTAGQYTVSGAPSICPDYIQPLGLNLDVLNIDCTTGTNEESSSNDEIIIFPNPSTDLLTIKSEDEKILDIDIYNSAGQLVNREFFSGKLIILDVSAFDQGFYFLEINSKTKKIRRKFIIQR